MFKKLISRFQKEKASDHPLASDEGLNALMAGIPQSDAGRMLFDVDEWLDGMDACVAEIGPVLALRALARLDQFSRPGAVQLLVHYLSAGEREYLSDSAWSALETHAGHLFRCYRSFLIPSLELKSNDDKLRMARCTARALMAWALRKKLQRFRYRTPSAELWKDAHELLVVVGRLGLLKTVVMAYRNEGESTPLDEYLVGLYLEFVPVGNMVPQQIEFADSFLRSCGGLDLNSQPDKLSTDQIDLASTKGPQRLNKGDSSGNKIRYCSVLKLRAALTRLATDIQKPEDGPDWLVGVPANRGQMVSAINILMTYWAPAPPKRNKDRINRKLELKVVLGFDLARRMVAVAHFARMGRSIEYEGTDVTLRFDEARFGTVTPQDADIKVDGQSAKKPEAEVMAPMDILRRLETGGIKALMETWMQADSSETGLGAVVPTVLSRYRIGLLICFRETEVLDWRLGLIRRIGRDAANRPSIGVETLAWPSLCALAKPAGEESAWTKLADGGGHGWSDAIIASQESNQLVLPAGAFVADMEVEVRSEIGLWRVRLDALLDRGSDYDLIQFTRIR